MLGSIGFPICAVFFLVLILIMYISKKKYKNTENKVFISLLIFSFFCVLSEFVYIYYLSLESSSDFIQILTCKLYLILISTWVVIYTLYVFVLLTKKMDKSIKQKNRKTIYYILGVCELIIIILTFFLDIERNVSLNGLYNFAGSASYVTYFTGFFALSLSFFAFIIKDDILVKKQKITFISTLTIIIITLMIQFIFPSMDYNIQTFQFAMLLLSLYITVESQDSKLLLEHEEQTKEADRINRIQTEFLSNMSHEIRTPMNTIIGFSDVLINENAANKDNVKVDIKYIHSAAISLLDLINNILDLSRMESGKEVIVEKEYDFISFICDFNKNIKNKMKENININLNVDNNMVTTLSGDYVKLNKIYINLVFSIIDYIKDQGEININITPKSYNNEYTICLNITSNGSFVGKEEYEEYYLKDNENANINSTVLEYNIAKVYAKMLGGKLDVISKDGYNLGYNLEIVQSIVDPNPIGDISELLNEEEDNSNYNFNGKKILVVDDNMVNIKLIERFLTEMGVEVDKSTSGSDCIEKVSEKKYDLLFLDHLMPGMDGVEVLGKLRDKYSDLPPIIALTANSYTGIRDEYINYGFNDYLSKPVNRNDLGKVLYRYLNK